MHTLTVLEAFAQEFYRITRGAGRPDIQDDAEDKIAFLLRNFMPHGSGFDNGVKLDIERSNESRLVFITSFHHMDEDGVYDGWTDHMVTVRPCFIGTADISVSGRNKNGIKDYIREQFEYPLSKHVAPYWNGTESRKSGYRFVFKRTDSNGAGIDSDDYVKTVRYSFKQLNELSAQSIAAMAVDNISAS